MKTKKLLSTIAACSLCAYASLAQFNVTGQYMNRAEYRHGYQSLADTAQKGSGFISQRARINGEFKSEKYRIYISLQDVRTWGSVANNAVDTKGLLSVAEAYGELFLSKQFTLKAGRQIISYDDDRIFGSLDWAMQARRHDAAILKYSDSTWNIHLGGAYNQNAEYNKLTQYTVSNNYKTFQYLWLNKLLGKCNLSLLALNNGTAYTRVNPDNGQKDSITVFSQTIGARGEYKSDKFTALAYAYMQFGKDNANKDLSAFDFAAEVGYKPVKGLLLTLGGEMLSGTSQTDTANKTNNSFNPLYGTNHRFNGYMDYFYVGNHVNSVGLVDAFFRAHYTYKKILLGLNTHMFSAAADVRDKSVTTGIEKMSSGLGTEIDFTLGYNFTDGVSIQSGYSQMFATATMKALKGGQYTTTSNWAYVMLIIRPGAVKWPRVGLKM
jgi:hypothetical protein